MKYPIPTTLFVIALILSVDRSIFFGVDTGFAVVVCTVLLACPLLALLKEKLAMAIGFFAAIYCVLAVLAALTPGVREEIEAMAGQAAPSPLRLGVSLILSLAYGVLAARAVVRRPAPAGVQA